MADHVREHRSVLAAAEKRLLIRIARRLPSFVHSDHLTGIALAAMALAGIGFALTRWDVRAVWLVVLALAINWFGDSLDGTVARVRGAERPRYGFYVDHVLDIVGITLLMAGLAASGFMAPLIALSVLVGYLLVSSRRRCAACFACRLPASARRSCASCSRWGPSRSSAIRTSISAGWGGCASSILAA